MFKWIRWGCPQHLSTLDLHICMKNLWILKLCRSEAARNGHLTSFQIKAAAEVYLFIYLLVLAEIWCAAAEVWRQRKGSPQSTTQFTGPDLKKKSWTSSLRWCWIFHSFLYVVSWIQLTDGGKGKLERKQVSLMETFWNAKLAPFEVCVSGRRETWALCACLPACFCLDGIKATTLICGTKHFDFRGRSPQPLTSLPPLGLLMSETLSLEHSAVLWGSLRLL